MVVCVTKQEARPLEIYLPNKYTLKTKKQNQTKQKTKPASTL